MTEGPDQSKPLSGVRVIEIGTSVAAPYAGWILATLGAQVVKIENKERGDDARTWGRMFDDGNSSIFLSFNGGKKSVTADLRDEEDRAWLKQLCESEADVIIQNMRPGKIADFGLDAAALLPKNPGLIYCNLGAFGARGPMKDRPGYDPLMQACGGIMSVTGEPDSPPVRVGVSIVDMGTGMWCTIGIISALYDRTKSGRGCIIDASLYETAVAWSATHVPLVQVDGRNPEKVGSGARGMAPYQAYECNDGYLVVSAPNDGLFKRLSGVMKQPSWPDDARFCTNQLRYENIKLLNAVLEPAFLSKTRDEWMDILEEAGIPFAPVRTITEMMENEQTQALGMLESVPGAPASVAGIPISFNGVRPDIKTSAPALGEHNDEYK